MGSVKTLALAILKHDWSPYMIDIYHPTPGMDFQMEIFAAIDCIEGKKAEADSNGSTLEYLGQLNGEGSKLGVWGIYLGNMMTIITITDFPVDQRSFLKRAKDIFTKLLINPLYIKGEARLLSHVRSSMEALVTESNK